LPSPARAHRAYGTRASNWLGNAKNRSRARPSFGAKPLDLLSDIKYLIAAEWALTRRYRPGADRSRLPSLFAPMRIAATDRWDCLAAARRSPKNAVAFRLLRTGRWTLRWRMSTPALVDGISDHLSADGSRDARKRARPIFRAAARNLGQGKTSVHGSCPSPGLEQSLPAAAGWPWPDVTRLLMCRKAPSVAMVL